MPHKGELLVRIVAALLTLGMACCLTIFSLQGKLSLAIIGSYSIAVFASAAFATRWPWRANSRARFYALMGVLWASAAASAFFREQTIIATLYGVAAAISFWVALITMSLHAKSEAGDASHEDHVPVAQ